MMSQVQPTILTKAIMNLGFESLNPMQAEMLNTCQKAKQILLYSPTGSGKTVAFLLPVLQRANNSEARHRSHDHCSFKRVGTSDRTGL
jgi:Superfamily II DNA and RNA helicases